MPTSGDTEQYSLDYSYRLSIDAKEIPIRLPSQILGPNDAHPLPSIRYLAFTSKCDFHNGYRGDILDLHNVVPALDTSVIRGSKELVELDIAISWFEDIEDFQRLACVLPKYCRELTIRNTVELCDRPLELLMLLELPRESWSGTPQIRQLSLDVDYSFEEDSYVYPTIRSRKSKWSSGNLMPYDDTTDAELVSSEPYLPNLLTFHLNVRLSNLDCAGLDHNYTLEFFDVPYISRLLLAIGGTGCAYTLSALGLVYPEYDSSVLRLLGGIMTEAVRREMMWIEKMHRRDEIPGWSRVPKAS